MKKRTAASSSQSFSFNKNLPKYVSFLVLAIFGLALLNSFSFGLPNSNLESNVRAEFSSSSFQRQNWPVTDFGKVDRFSECYILLSEVPTSWKASFRAASNGVTVQKKFANDPCGSLIDSQGVLRQV
jgi:hypothetical protein